MGDTSQHVARLPPDAPQLLQDPGTSADERLHIEALLSDMGNDRTVSLMGTRQQ